MNKPDKPAKDQELRAGEEQAMEVLLREMDPRSEPSDQARLQVRQAVFAEWQAAVKRASPAVAPVQRSTRPRARSFWWPAFAVAASVLVAVIVVGVVQWQSTTTPATVAKVVRLSGAVEVENASGWQPATMGQVLATGQELVTGSEGKAALSLRQGVTVRLDNNTRITVADTHHIVVARGAVYLDSGHPDSGANPASGTSDLHIDTVYGSTRHLGTQYEVAVSADRMLVSVREGKVAVSRLVADSSDKAVFVADSGEQLSVDEVGSVERSIIDRRDPRWNWIADITPPFAIESRRLSDFLVWVCRETGRDLVYSSQRTADLANDIVLRGSVAGMSPDEALTAVMATTNLSYTDENGRLVIRPLAKHAATR
ncbi:MAG: FecR family protein [Gammaproteobacteria bacterium]